MRVNGPIKPWHPRYWPVVVGLSFFWLISRLPIVWWPNISAGLGAILQVVSPSRKRVVLTNLKLAFPESSEKWRAEISTRSYRGVALTLLETSKRWYSEPDWLKNYIQFEGIEHLHRCQERGEAVLLLSCHYNSIEITGAALGLHVPYYPVYAKAKNAYFDQLQSAQRKRFWPDVVLRSDMRKAMRILRSKGVLSMLPDQSVAESHGAVPTQFFNQSIFSTTAPARLQKRSGAKVVMFEIKAKKIGYSVTVHPPLVLDDSLDLTQQTQAFNDVFEHMIRKDPGQYFWHHKRFKTGSSGINPYK